MLPVTLTTLLLVLAVGATPTSLRQRAVPQTITLTSRKVAESSSHFRRALSPINVPLTDYFNGTDLQ
jgi:hypothetical protein